MAEKGLTSQRWTKEEHLILVSAWLNISKSSTKGTAQKRGSFWKDVGKYYEEAGGNPRDPEALRKKWDKIACAVGKFGSCLDQVTSKVGSGYNEYDLRQQALELFENDTKTSFAYLDCWKIMRKEEKWTSTGKMTINNLGKRSRESDTFSSKPSQGRPMGQKEAKRKRREAQVSSNDSFKDKKFADYMGGIKSLNDILQTRNTLMMQFNQIFMSSMLHQFSKTDMSQMTPEQKFAYDMSYQGIANAMRASTSENPSTCQSTDENAVVELDDE